VDNVILGFLDFLPMPFVDVSISRADALIMLDQGANILASGEVNINAMDGGDMTPFLVSVVNGGVKSNEQWLTLDYFYNYAPPQWIEEYSHKLSKSVEASLQCIHNIDYKSWQPDKDSG